MRIKWLVSLLTICALTTLHARLLRGTVREQESGKGLANVIVTNGAEAIRTKSDGTFTLPFHHLETRFLSVVMPADRRAHCFYQRVTEQDTYDFQLAKRQQSTTFRFMHIADTETENCDVTWLFDRLKQFAKATDMAFLVHTGDIHTPEDQRAHRNFFSQKSFGRRAFFVLGNHDYKAAWGKGEECFEKTLGAHSYGFEEGNVTFIVLPMYSSYDNKPSYGKDQVARFFKNMMALIPHDKPVIIMSHFPENLSLNGIVGEDTRFPVDLKQWNVKAWIHGHSHGLRCQRLDCGLPLYDGNIAFKGGGSCNPASFNYYEVADDGSLEAHTIPTFPLWNVDIRVSPTPDNGRYTIAAAATSAMGIMEQVRLEVSTKQGEPQSILLNRETPYLWSTSYPLQKGKHYSLKAIATLNTGKQHTKTCSFSTEDTHETESLRLERIVCLPWLTLLGQPATGKDMVYYGLQDNINGRFSGVCALDAQTGKLRWRIPTKAAVSHAVVHAGQNVYAVDMDGTVYALKDDNGQILWQSPLPDRSVYVRCLRPPLVHKDMVYSYCGGVVRALYAASGQQRWSHTFKSKSFTMIDPMCMVGGTLCLLSPDPWNPLKGLDASTGKLLWQHPCKNIFSTPTLAPTPDGKLLLIAEYFSTRVDPFTGQGLYTPNFRDKDLESGTASNPLFMTNKHKLFIGNEFRGLEAYDSTTLKTCWNSLHTAGLPQNSLVANTAYLRPTPSVDSSPLAWGDHIVFAAMDGTFCELNADDGKLAGKLSLGVPFISSPARVGDRLFLADYAGRVFIFKGKVNP